MRRLLFFALLALILGAASRVRAGDAPPSITGIRVQGAVDLSTTDVLSALPFSVGDSYDDGQKKSSRELVLSFCRGRGYLDCDVNTRAVVDASSAAFVIEVREGPLYRFGPTRFEGLSTLPDAVVRRSLTYHEGDPFRRTDLFRTQSRLYGTNFFEQVSAQTSTTTSRADDAKYRPGHVPSYDLNNSSGTAHVATVTWTFKQKPLKSIKGGVGYGSEERERLSLILDDYNFLRRGYRGELSASYSAIWLEYKGEFVNSHFFGGKTEQRTSAAWRTEERQGYNFERIQGDFSFGRQVMSHTKGTLAYTVNRVNTFDVDPQIAAITPDVTNSRAVSVTLNRDTANDLFFPTLGSRTNLRLERSGGVLGGSLNYNRASAEARFYKPLVGPVLLAVAARGGVIKSYASSEDVPIYEHFFTGGANSVRGYRERDVGRHDNLDSPVGGDWLLGGNIELRFPIVWRFTGAAFLDGGQVGPHFRDVETNQWKFGSGAGLRFKTPVGPFRLDYGYKLNPDSGDHDHWRVHLSLGESF